MSVYSIPRSLRKSWTTIALALLLVIGSIWLLRTADRWEEQWLRILAYVAALLGILFFGGGAIVLIRFLSSGRPALIFESDGFVDNTTLASVGKVYWRDVTGFRRRGIYLVVDLVEPKAYFPEEATGLRRWLIKGNLRRYGTPVILSVQTVALNMDELVARLESKRQEYLNAKE